MAELVILFVLVFFNTIEQTNIGLYQSKVKYFDSYLVFFDIGSFPIPLLPGGRMVFILLSISVIASIFKFKLYKVKKLPLLTIHLGLLIFILGGEITYQIGIESQMAIREGETMNYTESIRDVEMVIIDSSDIRFNEVISIPHSRFNQKHKVISDPKLPFDIVIRQYFPNASFQAIENNTTNNANSKRLNPYYWMITDGLGKSLLTTPEPLSVDDEIVNLTTVIAELKGKGNRQGESLGVWLLSRAFNTLQEVIYDNSHYEIQIRATRYYNSYSVTLQGFTHERYLGTAVPKTFSSLVLINDPFNKEKRQFLISMNNPLRYQGDVFYQSSFGENDTLSILQVVKNPAWLFPYVGCVIVFIGMAWYFLIVLQRFLNRKLL